MRPRENDRLSSAQKLRFAALVLILFVAVPILLGRSPYFLTVLTNAAILSFISLGVWVTFSIGRMNLAQGAFALVGGYAGAILATRYGVSFWLCLPLSGLVSAVLGALIGWPVLRLKGCLFCNDHAQPDRSDSTSRPQRWRYHQRRDRDCQYSQARCNSVSSD